MYFLSEQIDLLIFGFEGDNVIDILGFQWNLTEEQRSKKNCHGYFLENTKQFQTEFFKTIFTTNFKTNFTIFWHFEKHIYIFLGNNKKSQNFNSVKCRKLLKFPRK